jgi:PilZ domain
MSERRSELRQRTLLTGRLAANHLTTLDCVVRNMSSRGAHLRCRTTGLGDSVSLEIKPADGFKKNARIVWRRIEDCGVEFV